MSYLFDHIPSPLVKDEAEAFFRWFAGTTRPPINLPPAPPFGVDFYQLRMGQIRCTIFKSGDHICLKIERGGKLLEKCMFESHWNPWRVSTPLSPHFEGVEGEW